MIEWDIDHNNEKSHLEWECAVSGGETRVVVVLSANIPIEYRGKHVDHR